MEKLIQNAVVSYGDVDREERLTLRGVFKFLQEAAIAHANKYDVGSHAMITRGESWVLNRMAAHMARYPRYEEALRIETWSSGIKGFKGYRDFRVFDTSGEVVIAASSLWLYVNTRTKSIIRVPRDVAEGFPMVAAPVFQPDLEDLEFASPDADAATASVTLRFGDIDANDHVNHTAYFDFVQTALAAVGHPPRPVDVRIKFLKGIPAEASTVDVHVARVAPAAEAGEAPVRFSVEKEGAIFAQGEVG